MPVRDFDYTLATPPGAAAIVSLLARVFSESDPLAVAAGLSAIEMQTFLQPIVDAILPVGLTVCAHPRGAATLAGVCFTDDFATLPALDMSAMNPKFLPIMALLETLDDRFTHGRTISPGQNLHLFMLGVRPEFGGHGVGQGLVAACLENGRRRGYRTAFAECTGMVSQHIFRKAGFAERFSVSYRDFLYENRPVFASIEGHDKAILMDRALA